MHILNMYIHGTHTDLPLISHTQYNLPYQMDTVQVNILYESKQQQFPFQIYKKDAFLKHVGEHSAHFIQTRSQ